MFGDVRSRLVPLAIGLLLGAGACTLKVEQDEQAESQTDESDDQQGDDRGGDWTPDDDNGDDSDGSDSDDSDDSDDGGTSNPQDEGCEPAELPELTTEPFAGGYDFEKPTQMKPIPGQPNSFYVVEGKGEILIVRDGEVLEEPFLDIRDQVESGYGEQGLLGLALHPKYEENGRFFIDYTSTGDSHNVIAEYERSEENPEKANPEEVRKIVNQDDPGKEHNGGTLAFGPDGYLYASLGNGASNQRNAHGKTGRSQNIESIFGTIMRLDVDRPEANFAAPGNPFIGEKGDDRIWLYGLRNAWRFSFDPKDGDLFIADVGRQKYEEIDYLPADSEGGLNYGWPAWQGPVKGPVYETAKEKVEEHTKPIFAYKRKVMDSVIRDGCCVIGGEVYRGDEIPELRGYYVFGDLCPTDKGAILYCDTDDPDSKPELVDTQRIALEKPTALLSAAVGHDGEIYFLGDTIRKLVKAE